MKDRFEENEGFFQIPLSVTEKHLGEMETIDEETSSICRQHSISDR